MQEDFILQRSDKLLIQSYGEYNGELLVKLTDGTLMVVASILPSGDVPPPPKAPRAAKQKRGLKRPVLEGSEEQDKSQNHHDRDEATL